LSLKKESIKLIESLNKGIFYSECPCCREMFALKDTGLFYLDDFSSQAQELYNQKICELKDRRIQLNGKKQKISKTSKIAAKSINIGKILERLAPCMETFPFNRNDCRSLFDPIDYIVFEGLEKGGLVKKMFFTDIKTGKARLTGKQKEIQKQTRQGKRLPNLTEEQLQSIANENEVGEVYRHLLDGLTPLFYSRRPTRSTIGFKAIIDGKKRVILSLVPGESNSEEGLKFRVYFERLSKHLKANDDHLKSILPQNKKPWKYYEAAPLDWSGYEGFFKNINEANNFLEALNAQIKK